MMSIGATLALLGGALATAEVEVISAQTPWRVHLTVAHGLARVDGKLAPITRGRQSPTPPSPLPPAEWTKPGFDDSHWGRYQDDLYEQIGSYGVEVRAAAHKARWPALLCLRTRFGVAAPDRVDDLTLSLTYIGGVVISVNGREVARGHMPGGAVEPFTVAEDYPVEAYVLPDGQKSLPRVNDKALEQYKERYGKRIRMLTVAIPRDALVRGTNVLAIEVHRAPVAAPPRVRCEWSHLGICDIRLTSGSGAGIVPYAEAAKGLHLWNASPMETVTEQRLEKLPRPGPMYGFARAVPVRGMTAANPFDPLRPMRLAGPRNGSCSGQIVFTDTTGLSGVTATMGRLAGPGGATIPAEAVHTRYAVQQDGAKFCDALMAEPREKATTQPVWLLVDVPREQAPGWYAGVLALAANKQRFEVPVQVLVSGYALPSPKDYRSLVGLMHSPDTLALHYGVPPWSDRHFQLLERTLEMLGQVGNDVVHVPVILHDHMGHRTGMVRFVKTGDGVKPDFTVLERYLDLWVKHCPTPQVINLIVWEPRFATTLTESYEGRRVQKKNPDALPVKVTALDPQTGTMTEMPAPMIGEEGSEAFWRPVLDGALAIVRKRGWQASTLMLGTLFDWRPTPQQVEAVRAWAPYARWTGFSHWSGDPGTIFNRTPTDPGGRFFATSGAEIGYKEEVYPPPLPAMFPNNAEIQKLQYLRAGAHRFSIHQQSSVEAYRNLAWFSGTLCRLGMDYWPVDVRDSRGRTRASGLLDPRGYRGPGEWRVYTQLPWALTAPGPDGPVPTARFQMVREAIQETEAWIAILQAGAALPAEQRDAHRRLWQEAMTGYKLADYLTQARLSLDWTGCVSRTYDAAGAPAGVEPEARWDHPPR
jgi:hypothetical protein